MGLSISFLLIGSLQIYFSIYLSQVPPLILFNYLQCCLSKPPEVIKY
jgi:hypothetical protein